MARAKRATFGEYAIDVLELGTVEVFRTYDNTIGALREIAAAKGFEQDPKWNTRTFGTKLINEYGSDGSAVVGEYCIEKDSNGSIHIYRLYANTIGALREIAAEVGFTPDPKWNTRTFGSKLVDYLKDKVNNKH